MKKRFIYAHGKEALQGMRKIIEDLWIEASLSTLYALSLEQINAMYRNARDQAMAFGEDISKFPRRLRWETENNKYGHI